MTRLSKILCVMLLLVLTSCDQPYYFADLSSDGRGDAQASYVETDVRTLAVNRALGTPGWQMAQDLCASRFAELGFEVERHEYGTGVNVVGVMPGTLEPEKHVIVGAHYDSVDDCIGADDNASGVAGTLEVARLLARQGARARTLVVACWDEEERGLVGSLAYAERAKKRGTEIIASYALEMIGYHSEEPGSQSVPQGFDIFFPEQTTELEARDNRGDFIALITDTPSRPFMDVFERTAQSIGLRTVELEFDAMLMNNPILLLVLRSDHGSFWLQGFPGVMITDTANFRNPNYHCSPDADSPDDLDYDFAAKVTQATFKSAEAALRSASR